MGVRKKEKIRKTLRFGDESYVDKNDSVIFGSMIGAKNETCITDVSVTYMQGEDNNTGEDETNTLTLSIVDGYYVLKCERWAFDDIEHFYAILKDFKKRFTILEMCDERFYEVEGEDDDV